MATYGKLHERVSIWVKWLPSFDGQLIFYAESDYVKSSYQWKSPLAEPYYLLGQKEELEWVGGSSDSNTITGLKNINEPRLQ